MADVVNPLFDGNLTVTIGGVNVTAAALPSLAYSNTNPGGFGEATMRLPATSPWSTYHASVIKGATVTIVHSGTTLFDGVVTNDLSHATIDNGFAYYDVTAAGEWWLASQKKDFCAVFCDNSYDQWMLGRSAAVPPITFSNDGKISLALEKQQTLGANDTADVYYWLHNGMASGESLRYLVCRTSANVATANWFAKIQETTDAHLWGTWSDVDSWTNTSHSDAFRIYPLTSGCKALRLRFYADADIAAGGVRRFFQMAQLCVVAGSSAFYASGCAQTSANPSVITVGSGHGIATGDTIAVQSSTASGNVNGWFTATYVSSTQISVPVLGNSGYTTEVLKGVRPTTAMCDIAGDDTALTTSLGASFTDGADGVPLYDLCIRPHMTRAEAIDTISMRMSEPLDYGFWESGAFAAAIRTAPTTAQHYHIDTSTTPGIDYNVGKEVENSPAYVKILYTCRDDATYTDGWLKAVYVPSAPDWDTATNVVEVWEDWADVTMTEAQAQFIGGQVLDWIDNNQYVGTITFNGVPTVTRADSTVVNTAYIRAGQYIEEQNHLTGNLMITSVSVNVDAGTVTLGIGETRRDFVARMTLPSRMTREPYGPGNPYKPYATP